MRRLIFVFSTVVLALGCAFAGDQDFVLVNETGFTIDEFYCSPVETQEWQEDVLGVDVLADGEKAAITFSRDYEECAWDLKVVDEEGDVMVWAAIDLCEAAQITLYWEDGKPIASIEKAESDDEGDDESAEADDDEDGDDEGDEEEE